MASVEVRDAPERDRFEVELGDQVVGFLAYRRDDRRGALLLTHAEVDPAFGGRGIGSVMVRGALDQLRDRGERVVPLCSFVRAFVHDHPEYRSLVAA